MTQVNIHEAKTHLSQLIKRALMGERIIIAKGNKPLLDTQDPNIAQYQVGILW